MGEEVATSTGDVEPLTRFASFCKKHAINPNLIMLKITLFVMYGATSSLLPYLTIHMQSIGLTVEEIAIIYLALPFTTFLSPPITGFLVDKFGKYKPVVVLSLLLNALFHHSLMLIPQQEIPGVVPAAYVMRHPESGSVEVWWSPCPSRECPEDEEIDIVVGHCADHCLLFKEEVPKESGRSTLNGSNKVDSVDLNIQIATWKNKLNAKDNVTNVVRSHNETNSNITITKPLEKTEPSSRNASLNGSEEDDSWLLSDSEEAAFFLLDMHPDLGDPIEQLGMEVEQDANETVTDFKQRMGESVLWKYGVNVTALEDEDLRCGGLVMVSNVSILYNMRLREWNLDCMIQKCEFRQGGPEICPPDYKESDDRVFWIYFLLRFLATTMLSAGVTIMDPIALTMIEKYGGDFGRERLFSSIGMAIFSPITGIMIDYFSRDLGYTDYSAAFYTYDVLLIISTITVLLMPLGHKLPADNVFRDLFNLLKMPHVIIFILFLFVLGNFWGFIESFLFLYLKELGAPNYLLGITITVGTVSSIPFLYGAEKITRVFGHVNLIIVAFFSHACRLVGYSFIESAWWCFPFEAMEALSCHLMWVAAATYCTLLAPKNLLATLIGVLGMAHFSLGRGSGSFCGGLLIADLGTREAFRFMGLLAVFGGISYGLLHLIWLRKLDVKNQDKDTSGGENGELENLREPKTRDQGTSMSQERLSLMIKFNQIGSLASLPRNSKVDVNDVLLKHRRSSYNIDFIKNFKTPGGSASKVDLLKSAIEINHKISNNSSLSKDSIRRSSTLEESALLKKVKDNSVDQQKMIRTLLVSEEPELPST